MLYVYCVRVRSLLEVKKKKNNLLWNWNKYFPFRYLPFFVVTGHVSVGHQKYWLVALVSPCGCIPKRDNYILHQYIVIYVDCYETRQVSLFHVFVRFFYLDPAQKHTFFGRTTNQKFRLIYSQLTTKLRLCRVTVNSTSIATALFLLLKFPEFHNQSLDTRPVIVSAPPYAQGNTHVTRYTSPPLPPCWWK